MFKLKIFKINDYKIETPQLCQQPIHS